MSKLAHLNAYADHFNLRSHMYFECDVSEVERIEDDRWKVTLRRDGKERKEIFDGLVIANDLRPIKSFDQFTGTISHSISYNKPDGKLHRDKIILIIGGGETASDLAVELSAFAHGI